MQMMMNRSCEVALTSKLRKIVVSLQNEIDNKNHKLLEMENKHSEALACLRKLIIGLTKNINSKERCLFEMECKYNESSDMVQKLTNNIDKMLEECSKELQQMKDMVSNKNHEMECLKKEHGELTKQLEESKALNDLQQNNFIEEIQKLKRELQNQSCDESDKLQEECSKEVQQMKDMVSDMNHEYECLKKDNGQLTEQLEESNALNDLQQKNFLEEIQKLNRELQNQSNDESGGNLNTQITNFRNQLKDKMEYLEHVENLNSYLIVKEAQYKQELLDARAESINSLHDMFGGRSQLGIKRMGELDPKPFQDLCVQKYSSEEWQEISAMLCSSWEENLKNSDWHPFKRIKVNGILQAIVDENDEHLKALRNEYGEVVYKAVVSALMEMEEYNPSGRYAIPEIWNWKEGRKATLKEIIQYIVRQLKTHKRKRKY